MALEDLEGTGKFISALNPTWPTDDDWVDEGDNHLRGIKNVLKNTFPNVDGVVTLTDEQLNRVTVATPDSRIINGNFAIDQRRAGNAATVNSWGPYTLDRWVAGADGGGVFNVQRTTHGNESVMMVTVSTTAASPAPTNSYFIGQYVEGFQMADWQWGTSGSEPQPVTFGCFMYSTVAGTFPLGFKNVASTASYFTTATLAANVWTPVSVTVPGTALGVWERTNGVGLIFSIGLGAGTAQLAPAANTWVGGSYWGVVGGSNFMATAGAVLRLRSVRLYPGSIDYGPCRRLYADELRLCQRYYSKSYDIETVPGAITGAGANSTVAAGAAAGNASINIQFPMPMRAAPSLMFYSSVTGVAGFWRRSSGGADVAFGAGALIGQNSTNAFNNATVSDAEIVQGHWTASAEL